LITSGLGTLTIDLQNWITNTQLIIYCTPETEQIIWFWQVVESYSNEMMSKLLKFVTGSSRVPLEHHNVPTLTTLWVQLVMFVLVASQSI
jgi:hypothetical protein